MIKKTKTKLDKINESKEICQTARVTSAKSNTELSTDVQKLRDQNCVKRNFLLAFLRVLITNNNK